VLTLSIATVPAEMFVSKLPSPDLNALEGSVDVATVCLYVSRQA